MHICIVSDVFYPEIQGDVIRIYKDALAMKDAGLKVTIVSPSEGIKKFYCYKIKSSRSLLFSIPLSLLEIHKKEKIDVIWLNRYLFILPVFVIAKVIKAKIVCEIHGPERKEMMAFSNSAKKRFYNLLYHLNETIIKFSDKVIVVEKSLATWLNIDLKVPKEKIRFIGNFPDLNIFIPGDNKGNSFTVGYLGSLQKGRINPLLDLLKTNRNINFLIIGDGEDKGKILNQKKINTNIELFSVKDYKKIPFYLHKISVGIVFSLDSKIIFKEKGPPMKLFEYLACGIPVIAVNLPDLKNILEDNGLGLVTDNGRLGEGIQKIRNNFLWYKNNALKFRGQMEINYSWQKEAEKIIQILEDFRN